MSTLLDTSPPSIAEANAGVLTANLEALARRCPRLAARIAATAPRPGLLWCPTEQNVPGADLEGKALASRRRPLDEAAKLAETVDPIASGAAIVLGFGLGYHIRALAERMQDVGVVAVFEPDVALLRAVFERIDHSAWLGRGTVAIFDSPSDGGAVAESIQGWEAPISVGIQIVDHPPSRLRLGPDGAIFADTFSKVVATIRTHVITTMMQMDVTVRNELMNLGHYLRWPGIGDLKDAARGKPAIVVSAGPSLKRNLDQLKQPGLRDRCVIVCVQTVLKQLLREGIRPHFVTALDYHEISRRFYEGLSAGDVEGITLIAEPKANPAILDAYPGAMRLIEDSYLEQVLGERFGGKHAPLRPGATVAHLAYYFSRYLGCDPVILIGQDLAFTDGQYYAKGAAIHQTWSGELNAFNTLEMLEWQRIIRMRGNLHEMTDHLGRRVYSDDQMAAYLTQFERDFLEDETTGLTVIDATEGGVRKAHTRPMPLREALASYAQSGHHGLSALAPAQDAANAAPAVIREVRRHIEKLRHDVKTVARYSRETRDLLTKTAKHIDDSRIANPLIHKIHAIRDKVQALTPAYLLVQRLNQTGTFKRFKADRAIQLDATLSPLERQRKQVERDSMNVGWVADIADVLEDLLGATVTALDGGPKRTRDVLPPRDESGTAATTTAQTKTRTGVIVHLDFDRSGIGSSRSVSRMVAGRTALRLTIMRLARCESIDAITIITDQEDRARAMLGDAIEDLEISFHACDPANTLARRRSVAAARLWARTCWRGGIANLTIYDECLDPSAALEAMEKSGLDAALIIGPDWCCVDPALCDQVIARHVESPWAYPITFTQAAPGLCGCVIAKSLMAELARGQREGDPSASIGGVLGYRPLQPRSDLIAHPCCVPIPPEVRDAQRRFIPDSTGWLDLERGMVAFGLDPVTASAADWTRIAANCGHRSAERGPCELTLEIMDANGAPMPPDLAGRILASLGPSVGELGVTLIGSGHSGRDALAHGRLDDIVHLARSAGALGVHIRTTLDVELGHFERFAAAIFSTIDILSIDGFANSAETYRTLAGLDSLRTMLERTDRLLQRRGTAGGLPFPWIVPRITRCDAVYEEIEAFFDKWLLLAGWAVIDQIPAEREDERITPLGKPLPVMCRDARTRMLVRADGRVFADERINSGTPIGDVSRDGVLDVWRCILERRDGLLSQSTGASDHPDLWTGW